MAANSSETATMLLFSEALGGWRSNDGSGRLAGRRPPPCGPCLCAGDLSAAAGAATADSDAVDCGIWCEGLVGGAEGVACECLGRCDARLGGDGCADGGRGDVDGGGGDARVDGCCGDVSVDGGGGGAASDVRTGTVEEDSGLSSSCLSESTWVPSTPSRS